jgi:signal transduction histidine kinase/ActR/RegA family two-component response regulator
MVELQKVHDHLEKTVAARTCDLQAAMEELKAEIARREQFEYELQQGNRMLQMVTACNVAVVRAATEQDLMAEVCRAAVEIGGYRMAWVGFPDDGPERLVRPVASLGFEAGYLEKAEICWAENERGNGPTGRAIRTGTVQIGKDFLTDPHLAHWRDLALARGFRSSICLPLVTESKTFGAINIYSEKPDAFDGDWVKVLSELAEDLAFGIIVLRTRNALSQSHDRLRALASELTLAEQRERRRLAKVLHDHLQQLLVGAKIRTAILGRAGDNSVRKAASEIEDLLSQSIEASRSLTAELSPPILHEGGLLAGLQWLARWAAERHSLTVDLSFKTERVPRAEDVSVLLFESIRELLFNVVKHACTRTASILVSQIGSDQLQIEVSDNGQGFDSERVFQSGSTVAGFGLFSIRERLDLVGGGMQVKSFPGCGTRVVLTAPLSETKPETKAPSFTSKSGNGDAIIAAGTDSGKRIRILLADDHIIMRHGLARLLAQEEDCQVVGEASDGQMAVDLARDLHPEVILMDLSMPTLNGIEATRIIHREQPNIQIIGLSMFEEVERAQAMYEAGAVAYITKSGASENLISVIRSLARRHSRSASL